MGVRFLKSIIENHCKNAYATLSMSSISNQTVIVDTNIFMYKFKASFSLETLFENMLKKFVFYNITPIFVFDGIPQYDKFDTIKQRKYNRDSSRLLVQSIKTKINNTTQKNKLNTLNKKLTYHQIQSTKLYANDFIVIKNLIQKYGFDIIQAKHEADEICAKHNINHKSFAVITEDTDLLIYGSKFVICNIDFNNDIFNILHTNTLLKTLHIRSLRDFQQICILSGTDYNKAFTIHIALCLYYFYIQTEPKYIPFLRWCYNNKIISHKQHNGFNDILDKYTIFNTTQLPNSPQLEQLPL